VVGFAITMDRMKYYDLMSAAFLGLLPFLALLPVVKAAMQPSEYSWLEKILYAPVYCLGRVLWRVEIVNGKKIAELHPKGAVIVANHRCSLDPFFIQLAAGRRVHWMVAGEYFRNPIFGPVLRLFQAIPTNRTGADNASMKQAIRLASEGRLVGMFPEGRINRTSSPLHVVRAGAGVVCMKSRSPLLPCWIAGAPSGWAVWSGLFMAAHVRVFIGQPVTEVCGEENNADRFIQAAMRQSLDLGGFRQTQVVLARSRRKTLKSGS
jgi:1-acyl-sn-glycerol-3-phosphate acyltransferase